MIDEHGQEKCIPLNLQLGRPISTHLMQAADNQGHVTLRLAYLERPLGTVRIDVPARPRGEKVWVWMELDTPSVLRVELEHEGQSVTRFFDLESA